MNKSLQQVKISTLRKMLIFCLKGLKWMHHGLVTDAGTDISGEEKLQLWYRRIIK